MTADVTLAALTAGLDRDEAIARAAGERSADWTESDCAVVGGELTPAEPEYGITETGEYVIVYDEGYPKKPEAIHIAHFDPKRALRQVEVFQRVLKLHAEAERDSALSDRDAGFEAGVYAALELLASIYTEEEAS